MKIYRKRRRRRRYKHIPIHSKRKKVSA